MRGMTAIDKLLDKAKDAIEAGESSLRKAAELIAKAQQAGATQKQISERVGKSRAWVTFVMAWRKGGYQGGAFDRSHKSRVSSPARQSNSGTVPEKSMPVLSQFSASVLRLVLMVHNADPATFIPTTVQTADLIEVGNFLLSVAVAAQKPKRRAA